MRFALLHISDLHRDLSDEVGNQWLLDSMSRDFERYTQQDPAISAPSVCVVSGDLVHGVNPQNANGEQELKRQYDQVAEFLIGLADRFFEGNRERVVILPGNHDVCFSDVMQSISKIEIPSDGHAKAKLVAELFAPNSLLRWSWRDLCFFKITDQISYLKRFRHFAELYKNFYLGKREYSVQPECQYDVFDFAHLNFSIVTLNSCFNNDPLRRAGGIHRDALAQACRILRSPERAGWLTAAAWHHNLVGGPMQDDYLDQAFVQGLIDAGASFGFHGHQHLPECFDERYRLGPDPRKITIVSASTLCAEPQNLRPGVPRSYNIIEVNTVEMVGRLYQRQMVNFEFNMPIWGPGHFVSTGSSFIDFELCPPLTTRPPKLDAQLLLNQAEELIGLRKWSEGLEVLLRIKNEPLARALLTKALEELDDKHQMIAELCPPVTAAEAVLIGGAILDVGTQEDGAKYQLFPFVVHCQDASVREVSRRIRERWSK